MRTIQEIEYDLLICLKDLAERPYIKLWRMGIPHKIVNGKYWIKTNKK